MRAGVLSMLALAGAVLPSACVRNDSTVFIRECMVVQHDTCIGPTPSTNTQFWTGGLLDTRYRTRYDCLALVENQLVARGDPNKARTETSRIEFYEAEVQILTPDTKTPANGYSVPTSQFSIPVTGFADPGSGADPGLGTVGINMIDAGTAKKLGEQAVGNNTVVTVVVSVVLHGKTLGGTEVQTNEFRYPLDICYGCLCDNSAVVAPDTCSVSVTAPAGDCLLGQDQSYDCRLTHEDCL